MNLIYNNPFRILGIPVSATEREIARTISDLTIRAEMGASLEFDSDLSFLPECKRTVESIKEASNRIEQPDSKLFYALFWFYVKDENDSEAFKILKEGSIQKALSIWSKSIEGGKVNKKNLSNAHNLSVLLLSIAQKGQKLHSEYFTKGVILAGKVFSSNSFLSFGHEILDSTMVPEPAKLVESWLDEMLQSLKPYLDTDDGISTREVLECLKYFPEEGKKFALDKFVFKPMQHIELEIENAKKKRTDKPELAKLHGVDLLRNVKEDVEYLQMILGEESLKYQIVADKLANEVLQCAVDFFNRSIDEHDEHKHAEDTRRLAEGALNVAVSERIRARIQSNIDMIAKWERDKEHKKLRHVVQTEIDEVLDEVRSLPFIKGLSYYERIRLPGLAETFVKKCKPVLTKIKDVLGGEDEFYQQLSSLVVNNALGMCVLYVNTTDDPSGVKTAMESLDTLDMEPEIRQRYESNRQTLDKIMTRRGLMV
ncbi:MAG: hypothetical protein CL946_13265 [Ectothiorhodospiraceae bacterium]|nr:hypothetical protein [Ectothiorhodospiraceae bacterium]